MQRAISIRLYQPSANYRKPSSLLVRESYPLPPYSTVIGMVHAACGFTEYHPMQISIQGYNEGETIDLTTLYNFGIKYDPLRHVAAVADGKGGLDGINRGPRGIHVLTGLHLLLHIRPEQETDEAVILRALQNPPTYLSLGRYEDLVRIDEVRLVELTPFDPDESTIFPPSSYSIYAPLEQFEEPPQGTVYHLRKSYHVDPKTYFRVWDEMVHACHSSMNGAFFSSSIWEDTQNQTFACLA